VTDRAALQPKTILVVDDDPDHHEILRGILGHFGYATRHVATVDEARKVLRDNPPDLILLDVHLNTYGQGLDLLYGLRASGDDHVPVVVCTADPLASGRYPRAAAAAAGWVLKPIFRSDLLQVVRDLIGPP
jgi:CheY-like chemotaxis protein